jgi:hypothetical protein
MKENDRTNMSIDIVLIPSDASKPLETHRISWDSKRNVNSAPFASKVHNRILSLLHDGDDDEDSGVDSDDDDDDGEYNDLAAIDDRVEVPLLRPLRDSPGLYAYFCSGAVATTMPNIRATRLAMACGLMSLRFGGNVVVARSNASGRPRWFDVTTENIQAACGISPDTRPNIQNEIAIVDCIVPDNGERLPTIPLWIKNAAEQNYHDAAAIARMVDVMKSEEKYEDDSESDQSDHDDESDNGGDDDDDNDNDNDNDESNLETIPATNKCSTVKEILTVTAKSPLCLHCRRPTNYLCEGCRGAYFCPPPRDCITLGWSHSCQCRTWKAYVSRREELSAFDYLDPEWQAPLVGREFQLSEEPYKRFLMSRLMINKRSMEPNDKGTGENMIDHKDDCSPSFSSWWRTETDGWAGGESASAQEVDITVRRSYEEGFAPIPSDQLPPSQRVCDRDYDRVGLSEKENNKNAVGLWRLSTWEEYYRLRSIPAQSPVALLCTFPLTIYRAIVEYGEVPVTVARMLQRPLRIHVVGTEKELNFLDLFQELGFLLPEDLKVSQSLTSKRK